MTYRPRMVRENEAYGWLPEDEAYGRVSNVPSQPEQEDENAYMPDFGKIVREYQEDIPLIVKYRDDFGEKK